MSDNEQKPTRQINDKNYKKLLWVAVIFGLSIVGYTLYSMYELGDFDDLLNTSPDAIRTQIPIDNPMEDESVYAFEYRNDLMDSDRNDIESDVKLVWIVAGEEVVPQYWYSNCFDWDCNDIEPDKSRETIVVPSDINLIKFRIEHDSSKYVDAQRIVDTNMNIIKVDYETYNKVTGFYFTVITDSLKEYYEQQPEQLPQLYLHFFQESSSELLNPSPEEVKSEPLSKHAKLKLAKQQRENEVQKDQGKSGLAELDYPDVNSTGYQLGKTLTKVAVAVTSDPIDYDYNGLDDEQIMIINIRAGLCDGDFIFINNNDGSFITRCEVVEN